MIALPEQLQPVASEARRFWTWWTSELAASIPIGLRERFDRRGRTEIGLRRHGLEIVCVDGKTERRFLEERAIEDLDQTAWEELASLLVDRSAHVLLDQRDVLCLTLDLPRRSGRNLPSTIALQLDFSSPIKTEEAAWSWTLLHADRERMEVLVALAKTSRLNAIEQQFEQHGLACPPIFCRTSAGLVRLRSGKRVHRSPEGENNHRAMIASLLILAATPFLLLICAHVLTARKEAQLNTLRRELASKVEADREARREAKLWQAYRPLRRILSASVVLSDLGRRAPSGTSIESIVVRSGRDISFELAGTDAGDAVQTLIASDGLLLVDAPRGGEDRGPVTLAAEMP